MRDLKTFRKTRDALHAATHAQWSANRHELGGALLLVHRGHANRYVRELAGEAFDLCLTTPIYEAGLRAEMERRDQLERSATIRA